MLSIFKELVGPYNFRSVALFLLWSGNAECGLKSGSRKRFENYRLLLRLLVLVVGVFAIVSIAAVVIIGSCMTHSRPVRDSAIDSLYFSIRRSWIF